jgi:hypothetical protein
LSLADDYPSPKAPFQGDRTGAIFDNPDLVLQSPATSERVVDTQSGFLVVVRRLGTRSTLSVKRRLGTPPVSSILLTPDEARKLSRILSGSEVEEHKNQDIHSDVSPNTLESASAEITSTNGATTTSLESKHPALERLIQPDPHPTKDLIQRALVLSLIVIVALIAGITLASHWRARQHKKPVIQAPKSAKPKTLTDEDIDKFARTYVSNLLDFSPESYKSAQVQAMSVMTPQLMSKYWRETNFPITEKQLKNNLKRESVSITKVVEQPPLDKSTRLVDVFAQLNSSDGKSTIPTHLQLKLILGASQSDSIQVSEQNDLTSSDK